MYSWFFYKIHVLRIYIDVILLICLFPHNLIWLYPHVVFVTIESTPMSYFFIVGLQFFFHHLTFPTERLGKPEGRPAKTQSVAHDERPIGKVHKISRFTSSLSGHYQLFCLPPPPPPLYCVLFCFFYTHTHLHSQYPPT